MIVCAAEAGVTGVFNGPHTGGALAALKKLRGQQVIGPSDRTVVISTAHVLKFTHSKVGYQEMWLGGLESRYANPPVVVKDDFSAVMDVLSTRLNK